MSAPEQVVAEEQKPTEVVTPEAVTPETPETPVEVLPPEAAAPEAPAVAEPSAEELRQQLAERDAEIERLKTPAEPEAKPVIPPPTQRVNMAQMFLTQTAVEAKKQFVNETDPAKQFDIVVDTADKLVGAVLHDTVNPGLRNLAAANIELANELEIRDLRADPEFKALEPKVRALLKNTPYQQRAMQQEDGTGIVTATFHRLRGAKTNGPLTPAKAPAAPPSAARTALKDLAAGGGASPKPASVRLTGEQEADFNEMVENGINITRAEYYAKTKSRQDQAKANGKPIPKTFRG